jgi:hypothetical protein
MCEEAIFMETSTEIPWTTKKDTRVFENAPSPGLLALSTNVEKKKSRQQSQRKKEDLGNCTSSVTKHVQKSQTK